MSPPGAKPTIVVGVGASAGGLRAFKELVATLPRNGAAYLLVQHLDPSHKSVLAELLAPHTALSVCDAAHGQVLRPNHIYVIRPDTSLSVRDGKIVVGPSKAHRGIRLPVDHLFRSLAEQYRARAVGIVLSGAGSDGTAGLREIHGAGGLTIAQSPESCEQLGMPQSAVEAGVVDFVLELSEMADLVGRYKQLPLHNFSLDPVSVLQDDETGSGAGVELTDETPRTGLTLDEQQLSELGAILSAENRFDLSAYKIGTVQRRVLRRMMLAGFEDPQAYLDLLRDEPSERDVLVRDLLISVTEFFRDPSSFEALQTLVIQPLVQRLDDGDTIRAWVSGCATGEEAYSLAIELFDAIDSQKKSLKVQIFATDVDQDALSFARAGLYSDSIAARISERRLQKYFAPLEGRGFRVRPRVRDSISFSVNDATRDPPFSRMDMVLCRNVLIYLTAEAQEHALKSMHFALNQDGALMLGGSESVGPQRALFQTVSKPHRIFRRSESSRPLHIISPRRRRADTSEPPKRAIAAGRDEATDRGRQAVLRALVPPTVVIDSTGRVTYAHGELSPYLTFPQGDDPRLEFTKLVRDELATRARAAFYRCRRNRERVESVVELAAHDAKVRFVAVPTSEPDEHSVVFSFVDIQEMDASVSDKDERPGQALPIEQLERELFATREDLRSTVQELEASNEELRSSNEESLSMNEELQSANEELEASSEELRSLNEELTTVNVQLREKIEQLEKANDDLSNFFSSTRIPTLFLDEELRVQQFSPAAGQLLGLDYSDLGRRVVQFSNLLLRADLESDVNAVLQDLAPHSQEIESEEGSHFVRRILPYRTESRRIEGVVVTFQDVTDIRKTQRDLEHSEELLRVAAEAARFGTFDRDLRTGEVTWSNAFKRILGIEDDASPPISMNDLRFVHPDDRELVQKMQEEFFDPSGDGKVETEHRIVRADGEVRWVRSQGRVFFEGEGKSRRPVRLTGMVFDITERKRAELAARESEARMRRLFDQAPAMIAIHEGPAHHYIYSNQLHSRAVGGRILLNRSLREAFPDLEGQSVFERFDKVYTTGVPIVTEAFAATFDQDGDGDMREGYFTQVLQPHFDANGNVAGVMSFAFDVTSEVRLTQEAEEISGRLEIAKRAAGLGVHDYDIVNNQIEWDDRVRELWGVQEDEAITYEVFAAGIHPDDRERVEQELASVFEPGGSRRFESDYRVIHRVDGEVRWIRATGNVLFEGEQAIRIVGTVEDISEARAAREQLKETQRQLREADQQKDQFLAMLGHELRNPLAAIRGASDLLKIMNHDAATTQKVQSILERQTSHMAKLLDGLLDVSRIARGKVVLEKESIDLAKLCREVIADRSAHLRTDELRIETVIPDAALWVDGDGVRLAQVIDNLFTNACKYTDQGGRVVVSLERDGTEALLTVSDTGIGIDPELLPHIFELFRQTPQGLNRSLGGLGLGLSLVKGLVELHGGEVKAYSEGRGKGARFEVRLPLAKSAGARKRVQSVQMKALSVLIIEDNEDVSYALQNLLEAHRHTVHVAMTGEAGLKLAIEQQPDVVLCDLGLPKMSGLDVARELTKASADGSKKPLLVAVTGYGTHDARERGFEAGFDAYLNKPVSLDALERLLAECPISADACVRRMRSRAPCVGRKLPSQEDDP